MNYFLYSFIEPVFLTYQSFYWSCFILFRKAFRTKNLNDKHLTEKPKRQRYIKISRSSWYLEYKLFIIKRMQWSWLVLLQQLLHKP